MAFIERMRCIDGKVCGAEAGEIDDDMSAQNGRQCTIQIMMFLVHVVTVIMQVYRLKVGIVHGIREWMEQKAPVSFFALTYVKQLLVDDAVSVLKPSH